MSGDDDHEIPESGAVFTFGRSQFAENLSSHFFVRNDPVAEISCGDDHTALVCNSGRVFLFGRNDYGQLGFGHNKVVNKPSCLKYLKPFHSTHIACGKGHTIVSTNCNRIFTFGCNNEGQLGIGDLIDRSLPQMVHMDFLGDDGISAVAAGCYHSGFLTEKGHIYMWGSNSDGQCGAEDIPYFAAPQKVEFNQPINSLSCGYYHTAFTSLGSVYTFGEEDNGKLGRLRKSSNCIPNKVEIDDNCTLVKCGGSHTMVLSDTGAVYAFGSNFSGQLGIQSLEAESSTPTCVEFPESNVKIVYISCGESHSAFLTVLKPQAEDRKFITEKGSLYTSGDSRYGKLCNEDESTNHMTPTLIEALANYFCMFVSCGGCHTMVLAKVNPISNNKDSNYSQSNEDTLPPLKSKKDFPINSYPAKPAKEPNTPVEEKNESSNEEKHEKNSENIDERDSKSNTESNLINEEVNSQLDDIYTEIEEITHEKNGDETKTYDSNIKQIKKPIESKDNDVIIPENRNPVKKLLSVFKRKKSASAILLNEQPVLKVNDGTQTADSLKTGSQDNSRTCVIL